MPSLDLDDAAIVAAYAGGESIQQIARRLDVATDTVSRRLKLAGVQVRIVQRRLPDEDVLAMRRLASEGAPIRGIAVQWGMAYSSVAKIISGESYSHVREGAA